MQQPEYCTRGEILVLSTDESLFCPVEAFLRILCLVHLQFKELDKSLVISSFVFKECRFRLIVD